MQRPKEKNANDDWRRLGKIVLGIGNANLLAATVIYLIAHYLEGNEIGYFGTAATVLVPILMGVTASYCWRDLKPSNRQSFVWSLYTTFIGLGLGFVFFKEGSICLIMASPLLLAGIYVGVCIGKGVFRDEPGPLNVSLVPLLLIAIVVDSRIHCNYESSVTTTWTVHATPAAVYPYIIAFPEISAPSNFWLCRAGLPYPVETTADGRTVGARRDCKFNGNLDIGEKITKLIPNQEIDFDVVQMLRFPEIANHATLERGRIALRDNGDGTTTLVGTSWYNLRVFPGCYFGLWSDYLIHQVHERVFAHIADLAEAQTHSVGKSSRPAK